MNKASVRDLHLNTSSILKWVAEGVPFIIENRGIPVAELRPLQDRGAARRFPNREKLLAKLPRVKTDTGRILEEDRS
jgi:antitoxin (DNA-binding transcriptional repressor) of toxin-antitoxin stability system